MHIGEYAKGGVATYLNEVINYQKKCEDVKEIHLMVSKTNSELDFNLPEDNKIFYEYKRNFYNAFKAICKINSEIKRVKPDIVHIHSTFAGFFVRLPLFFKKKKYKVVYCSHGWAFLMELSYLKRKLFIFIEKFLSIKTDKVVNISWNEHKESINIGISRSKAELVNNGIDNQVIVEPLNVNLDSTQINLLFVGRFDRQKGLDILIEFFNQYSYSNIKLYVIGEKVLKNSNMEITENIINLGWVDNKKLNSYYQLFDAVIIPSRWEGFGLVAVEAMRNKKPIIVSDRGALPDLVGNDNGYIFSLNQLSTLEQILNSLNKAELRRKGLNGYDYFMDNFTSEIMNKKIIDVYKQII